MSETQIVTHQNIGHNWGYSLEVESVAPPVAGSRASAKTTEKFSCGGNTLSFDEMGIELFGARLLIKNKVENKADEKEKNEEE